MPKGFKKLKYYNPFDIKLKDKIKFCFFDNKILIGKVLEIDYPLLLVNSNYDNYVIYIGQCLGKEIKT